MVCMKKDYLKFLFKKCNLYFCDSFGELAQLARALAWHARGHRFDSGILHHGRDYAAMCGPFFHCLTIALYLYGLQTG